MARWTKSAWSRILRLRLVSSSLFKSGIGVDRLLGSHPGGLARLHPGACSALVFCLLFLRAAGLDAAAVVTWCRGSTSA